jgi:hypothetical protein
LKVVDKATSKYDALRRVLREMRPGEVVLARGFTAHGLRLATNAIERERKTEGILFAIDSTAHGHGGRRDRYIVCGQNHVGPERVE